MSYRHRIHLIDKKTAEALQRCESYDDYVKTAVSYAQRNNKTVDFEDEDVVINGKTYPDIPFRMFGTELFDFGSGYDNAGKIQAMSTRVFKNAKLAKHFEEYEPFLISKEGLRCAIEYYRDKIIKELTHSLAAPLNTPLDYMSPEDKCKAYVHEELKAWKQFEIFGNPEHNVYNLGEGDNLTSSCYIEFAIWDLVRIYKTFDWENNCMLFYGW